MNIDVKNSLDKLLYACERIESAMSIKESKIPIKMSMIEDIWAFINIISKNDAEERIHYFNAVYLEKDYKANIEKICRNDFPVTLSYFFRMDNEIMKKNDVKTSLLFLDFMMGLGKYYLFSKYD